MADAKISELINLTSADNDDLLAIVDNSATQTKKISVLALKNSINADDIDDTATTNKFATDGQLTKIDYLTVTGAKDLDAIEDGADVTDATNVEAAGAVMESDTSTASMSFVVDEDAMTSDSDTKVPTQQSVKAYVDNKVAVQEEEIIIACSDETTDLEAGTAKVTFRMPFAMTVDSVRASVVTAPVGANLQVDINEGGTSILSTVISIDAGEKTSTTAATTISTVSRPVMKHAPPAC